MNKWVAVILGLVGGFVIGLVVSEMIGIVGKLAFDRTAGIKFLPIYTAVACAVIAPVVLRRRSG